MKSVLDEKYPDGIRISVESTKELDQAVSVIKHLYKRHLAVPAVVKGEVTNVMYLDGQLSFYYGSDMPVEAFYGRYGTVEELLSLQVNENGAAGGNPKPKNKYDRIITTKEGSAGTVDVYRVLTAFNVTNPQLQHLVKKGLCAGLRGHKDELQDLLDIRESINSAIEMYEQVKALGEQNG